jgi:hypothetical protein
LQIEQLPKGGTNPLYEISPGQVGAIVVERTANGTSLRRGVCIKRHGEQLLLPASMLIAAATDNSDLTRFCANRAQTNDLDNDPVQKNLTGETPAFNLHQEASNVVARKLFACTWNGIFHSSRPFTVTLVAQDGDKVSNYVEYLRIYRNGDLLAAWNRASDQRDTRRVVIPGSMLTTNIFAATQPPHLSAMDIRVIPRDEAVSQTVDTQARSDRQQFESRLLEAGKAAIDIGLPKDSKERHDLECLRAKILAASRQIKRVVNGEVQTLSIDPTCTYDLLAGGESPISIEYGDLKNQAQDKLDALRRRAEDQIAAWKADLERKVPAAALTIANGLLVHALQSLGASTAAVQCIEALPASLDFDCVRTIASSNPNVKSALDQALATIRVVDSDLKLAAETADETRLLAERLYDDAKQIVSSPAKQEQIFNAFAQSLNAQGSVFEARRDNPALLAGEQKIDMAYGDKWQTFLFAPWNGIPMRVNNNVGADFSAAVAVPLIDVVGFRYQWARSRFADLRFATGIGYTTTQGPSSTAQQSAALLNASIGLGTMKIGLGFVAGQGLGNGVDRLRLLVGLDLYKLLTGSNTELL